MAEFTLIYGCMFAGKTTRLIEIYHESAFEPHEKLVIKPMLDNRYAAGHVSSHVGKLLPAQRMMRSEQIVPLVTEDIRQVFIDEVQFFDSEITGTINYLLIRGVEVIASGLDRDYLDLDFGPMPELKKIARNRIELFALCSVCGKSARHTYRKSGGDSTILVGHSDLYEARCTEHYVNGSGVLSQG